MAQSDTLTESEYAARVRTLNVDESVLRGPASASIRPAAPSEPSLEIVSGADEVTVVADPNGAESGSIRLESVLGEGGMGVVHVARQVPLRRQVAVKSVRPEVSGPVPVRELMREAWVTGALEHPNVVPVYALDRSPEGRPWLVMKRVVGRPWSAVIEEDRAGSGFAAALDRHLSVLMDVCRAVHFAHSRGVVHRDLKPDNVMLGDFGEVYVVDWGIAVAVRADADPVFPRLPREPRIVGTPCYMAPEMAAPDYAPLSIRTDVYLLGAILHELVSGERRHLASSAYATLFAAYLSKDPAYRADVPAELASIARKAMSRDPSARFATAEAFRDALEGFLRHRTSARLAADSSEKVSLLEAVVARPRHDASEVHRLAGAARFGFEQALAGWPENAAAKAGLQRTLELLLEHELAVGDHVDAARLLAELPEKRPDFEQRVEALVRSAAAEKARVAALEELGRDMDVGASFLARRVTIVVFGVVWSAVPFFAGALQRRGLYVPNPAGHLLAWAGFAALVGALVFRMRRLFFVNQASARMVWSLVAMLVYVLAVRSIPMLKGESVMQAAAYEMAGYGVISALLGVWMDRVLLVASPAYVLCAIGAALFPEWTWEWLGLATGVALGAVAILMWSPSRARRGPSESNGRADAPPE